MKKKIIFVDQASSRKFLVEPGPDPVCPACPPETLAAIPQLARQAEFFDPLAAKFSIACANCGQTLQEYPARERNGSN